MTAADMEKMLHRREWEAISKKKKKKRTCTVAYRTCHAVIGTVEEEPDQRLKELK